MRRGRSCGIASPSSNTSAAGRANAIRDAFVQQGSASGRTDPYVRLDELIASLAPHGGTAT
jgi:hypothetical protein